MCSAKHQNKINQGYTQKTTLKLDFPNRVATLTTVNHGRKDSEMQRQN